MLRDGLNGVSDESVQAFQMEPDREKVNLFLDLYLKKVYQDIRELRHKLIALRNEKKARVCSNGSRSSSLLKNTERLFSPDRKFRI